MLEHGGYFRRSPTGHYHFFLSIPHCILPIYLLATTGDLATILGCKLHQGPCQAHDWEEPQARCLIAGDENCGRQTSTILDYDITHTVQHDKGKHSAKESINV
jgi:hypothetical protein